VDEKFMPTLDGIEREGGAHRAEADVTDFHAAHGQTLPDSGVSRAVAGTPFA
jgi:hypothetical protein